MKILPHLTTVCLLPVLLILNSCDHCPDGLEYISIPHSIDTYSNGYVSGNYFLFHNQDSTKTDSLYVTDFKTSTTPDRIHCMEYEHKDFTLHSDHLLSERLIEVHIDGREGRGCFSWTAKTYNGLAFDWVIGGCRSDDTLRYFHGSPLIHHEYLTSGENPYTTFYDVWEMRTEDSLIVFLAPQVGIVKFLHTNTPDTFYLTSFLLQ